MKQIFTLFGILIFTLISHKSIAQFYEGFERSDAELTNNCWKLQHLLNTTKTTVISGQQSLISTPLTNGKVQGKMTTPYLNVSSTSFTLSFKWSLLNKMPGKAWREIKIWLQPYDGSAISIGKVEVPSGFPVGVNTYTQNVSVPAPGIYQLYFEFEGNTGDGNQRLIFDDLTLTGAQYNYGPENNCNSAPIARDDEYEGPLSKPILFSTVLVNDIEPNGETITPVLVNPPLDGIVTFNPDGTFLFTPNIGFTGTTTTFTYFLRDNGYKPLTSTPATVTINFFEQAALPVKLIDFKGSIKNNHAVLQWEVAENEIAQKFEVQKSSNGIDFLTVAIVKGTKTSGNETYSYKEPMTAEKAHYRLRMFDTDGVVNYSNTIALYPDIKAATGLNIWNNLNKQKVTFSFNAKTTEELQCRLIDVTGRTVQRETIQSQTGNNTINLPFYPQLQSGFYIMELSGRSGRLTGKLMIP